MASWSPSSGWCETLWSGWPGEEEESEEETEDDLQQGARGKAESNLEKWRENWGKMIYWGWFRRRAYFGMRHGWLMLPTPSWQYCAELLGESMKLETEILGQNNLKTWGWKPRIPMFTTLTRSQRLPLSIHRLCHSWLEAQPPCQTCCNNKLSVGKSWWLHTFHEFAMFTLTIFDNFTLCNPNSSHLQMSHLWTYGLLRCHLWITKFSSSHDEKPLHFNSFLFAKSIFGSQVAGRYRLQGEIGSGSYSEVYLGVDEKTGSRSWKLLWSPRLSLAEAIRLMVKYQYHPISRWPSGNLTLWTCLRKVNQNACTLTFFGFSQRPIGPWAVEIPSHDERRMLDGLKLELSRGPMTDGIWLWRLVWNVPHSSTMGACENDWKWSWSSDHDPKGFGGTLFSDKPWQSYM